jgi:hypothetical protein
MCDTYKLTTHAQTHRLTHTHPLSLTMISVPTVVSTHPPVSASSLRRDGLGESQCLSREKTWKRPAVGDAAECSAGSSDSSTPAGRAHWNQFFLAWGLESLGARLRVDPAYSAVRAASDESHRAPRASACRCVGELLTLSWVWSGVAASVRGVGRKRVQRQTSIVAWWIQHVGVQGRGETTAVFVCACVSRSGSRKKAPC